MDETDVEFAPDKRGRPTNREREDRDPPRYLLVTAQYMNDTYYGEDQEIIYRGVPNYGMEPRNATAEKRFAEWEASLPAPTKQIADFSMEAFANRPRYEIPAPQSRRGRTASRVQGKETAADTAVEVVPQDPNRIRGPKKQMGTIVAEVPSPGSI